jgi:hypothetical protein
MPAFNDANASSSEIGGSRHLWTGLRDIFHEIQKNGTRHHHQTVLEVKGEGGVNEVGDDFKMEVGTDTNLSNGNIRRGTAKLSGFAGRHDGWN